MCNTISLSTHWRILFSSSNRRASCGTTHTGTTHTGCRGGAVLAHELHAFSSELTFTSFFSFYFLISANAARLAAQRAQATAKAHAAARAFAVSAAGRVGLTAAARRKRLLAYNGGCGVFAAAGGGLVFYSCFSSSSSSSPTSFSVPPNMTAAGAASSSSSSSYAFILGFKCDTRIHIHMYTSHTHAIHM